MSCKVTSHDTCGTTQIRRLRHNCKFASQASFVRFLMFHFVLDLLPFIPLFPILPLAFTIERCRTFLTLAAHVPAVAHLDTIQ